MSAFDPSKSDPDSILLSPPGNSKIPSVLQPKPDVFLGAGRFQLGTNYWASHAGTRMWEDWREDVVAEDFVKLSQGGMQVLRVFPLWSDFQPISRLRQSLGQPVEFRHGEVPLTDDEVGQSGLSMLMLERFERICRLAAQNQLGLVVSLITGWMSGRLFAPPGLEGLNPITDPLSILWQVRFVKTFVKRMRGMSAIRAWGLGNECNCLGEATAEQSALWTATVAGTIRAADPTRPVVSDMHGLTMEQKKAWNIRDQAEWTDILTTHPYPLFTPHCNREPMDTMRPLLHATAETRYYADLAQKPAFVEEIGNFGPAFCDQQIAAHIARVQALSLWAHDGRALLWWCAHDQCDLEHAPYDWISMERQLGLLNRDGSPKPVMEALTGVCQDLQQLPFSTLPPRQADAICILTNDQDQWGVAYSAFVLSQQAGFDLQFCDGNRDLPEGSLYLLPSVRGLQALSRRAEMELIERVRKGATLYVSIEDGFLAEIMKISGLHVVGRHGRKEPCRFTWNDSSFLVNSTTQFHLRAQEATVLAREEGVVFSVAPLERGRVFFLAAPMESHLAQTHGAFLESEAPFWKIYREIASEVLRGRRIEKCTPTLGISEHPLPGGEGALAVLINYSPNPLSSDIGLPAGTRVQALLGPPPEKKNHGLCISLPPLGAAVWKLSSRSSRNRNQRQFVRQD